MRNLFHSVIAPTVKALNDNYERPISAYSLLFLIFNMPRFLQNIVRVLIKPILGERIASIIPFVRTHSFEEIDAYKH